MHPRLRLTFSQSVVIGLVLGILVGLFFGEGANVLQPVADIYVRLMQMTVLPYLVLALVVGFGQLEAGQARKVALRAGALLLVTWSITCAVVAVMPAAFPGMQTASFFSNALVNPSEPFSLPDLYFTANPFNSLANAVVPAVALFSTVVGVALIGVTDRERLLGPLRVASSAIANITRFITKLTPVGVFAIVAVTAGTMRLSTLTQLQVYFVAFMGASLLLGLCVLPLMVTAVTPFRYREVVGIARSALLTAFVTSNAFIVLPILVDQSRALLARHGLLDTETESAADILIPILFNFPGAGRLLTLLFVPFAGWLAGSPLTAQDLWLLFAVGIPSYFAKAQVALPFLLDLLKLPHDLFQLYIPTTVITGKFDSFVTAMNLLMFALIGATSMRGGLRRPSRRALVRSGLVMLAATALTVVAVRVVLHATVDTTYSRDRMLLEMRAMAEAPARVQRARPPRQDAARAAIDRGVEAVRARGRLRVGYDPENVPFSFFNTRGELVGFDVELGQQLARSLGVEAEFVPIDWQALPSMLATGDVDVMPGMWVRPYWFGRLALSESYFTGTIGLVVRDERRQEFAQVDAIRRRRGLRVGVPLDPSQLAASMQHYFGPGTQFVRFESPGRYFAEGGSDIDAFLMPAEGGSASTLLHPEYTVVVPQPRPIRLPYAFGLARDAGDLMPAVNEWVVYATSEGTVQRAYDYWILGQGATDSSPRWSILHDVLGWSRSGE